MKKILIGLLAFSLNGIVVSSVLAKTIDPSPANSPFNSTQATPIENATKDFSFDASVRQESSLRKTADGAFDTGEKRYNVDIDTFARKETASGDNGIELITSYISLFYKAVASIIGLICVLIVVISGVQITMGGIDPEGVNQAKERILQAIFSLLLLFGSALLLKTVNPGFFLTEATPEAATADGAEAGKAAPATAPDAPTNTDKATTPDVAAPPKDEIATLTADKKKKEISIPTEEVSTLSADKNKVKTPNLENGIVSENDLAAPISSSKQTLPDGGSYGNDMKMNDGGSVNMVTDSDGKTTGILHEGEIIPVERSSSLTRSPNSPTKYTTNGRTLIVPKDGSASYWSSPEISAMDRAGHQELLKMGY